MQPIKLVVSGIGPTPSFKNAKKIGRGKLYTDPEVKAWMDRCAQAIVSQLSSLSRDDGIGTSTACVLPSWIVSSLPLDDCSEWIRELSVSWQPSSEEGFELTIEKLPLLPRQVANDTTNPVKGARSES